MHTLDHIASVMSHVVLFAYPIKLNISTKGTGNRGSGGQGIGESGIGESGNPGIGESGNQEIGESENRGIRKSGNQESLLCRFPFLKAGYSR